MKFSIFLTTAVTSLFFIRISPTWRMTGIFFPCFCRCEFRVYAKTLRAFHNVNDRARRDLPVRRTKGYKAFANGMIRELFRVTPRLQFNAFANARTNSCAHKGRAESRYFPKKLFAFFVYNYILLYSLLLKRASWFLLNEQHSCEAINIRLLHRQSLI